MGFTAFVLDANGVNWVLLDFHGIYFTGFCPVFLFIFDFHNLMRVPQLENYCSYDILYSFFLLTYSLTKGSILSDESLERKKKPTEGR